MVEVTSSSSSGSSLSAQKSGSVDDFDLNSWQGLTEVLQAARAAGLDSGAYSSFRDMVLEYAQAGGDVELRKKIHGTVATFSKVAQKFAESEAESDTQSTERRKKRKRKRKNRSRGEDERIHTETQASLGLGTRSRPTPVFTVAETLKKPAESAAVSADQSTKNLVSEERSTDAIPVNLPTEGGLPKFVNQLKTVESKQAKPVVEREVKNVQPAVAMEPREPTSGPSPTKPQPSSPPEKAEPLPAQNKLEVERLEVLAGQQPAVSIQSSPDLRETPPVATEVTDEPKKKSVTELQASAQKVDAHKARIAEIKHDVNTKIGNPVALIDNGNDIGRQYMSALLQAMKATSGGQIGSLDLAMAKLEKVYELMKKSIEDGVLEKTAPPIPETHLSGKMEELKEVTRDPVEVATPTSPLVRTNFEPQEKSGIPSLADLSEVTERVQKRMANAPTEAASSPPSAPKSVQKEPPQIETEQQDVLRQRNELKAKTKQSITPPPSHNPVAKESVSVRANASELVKSIAPRETVTGHSPNQSAISSPEVTSALNELLNEWKIFKGSGLFGMGPSGPESPLYQQLKNLSMFAVLAGRWENSTADVKQAIKDYVNAWRHEQGITYNPSETFEHYLRRVVLRILERQKQ